MDHLWAPWRKAYVTKQTPTHGTLFDEIARSNEDERFHVLVRGKSCFSLLNAYPYNAGHSLVLPYRMVTDLDDLSADEMVELWQMVLRVKSALTQAYKPNGFNVGINLGTAAGAGIASHLHVHIVPRWNNDVNFMTATADIRVHPNDLDSIWKTLRPILTA